MACARTARRRPNNLVRPYVATSPDPHSHATRFALLRGAKDADQPEATCALTDRRLTSRQHKARHSPNRVRAVALNFKLRECLTRPQNDLQYTCGSERKGRCGSSRHPPPHTQRWMVYRGRTATVLASPDPVVPAWYSTSTPARPVGDDDRGKAPGDCETLCSAGQTKCPLSGSN